MTKVNPMAIISSKNALKYGLVRRNGGKAASKGKMTIPLRFFEKQTLLTPYQVDYLKEYRSRVALKDAKTLARIDSLLAKQITPLEIKGDVK